MIYKQENFGNKHYAIFPENKKENPIKHYKREISFGTDEMGGKHT